MFHFGLKLWSINKIYIEEAEKLYEEKLYDYIELYTVPNSYEEFGVMWSKLNIPYIIHAPHFLGGLNLSRKESKEKNMKMAEEVIKFGDKLKSETIIFHPGVDGDIRETASQLKEIGDRRILIENKPFFALKKGNICNGNSPEEIKFIMEKGKVSFCLDIGHAVCAANAYKKDSINFIKEFLKLKPKMFHLTDGDFKGLYDSHEHFRKGTFPIKKILDILPDSSSITVEVTKDSPYDLNDFSEDIKFLKKIAGEVR